MTTKQIDFLCCRTFDVCVVRMVNGEPECLPLENQGAYREYNGCFTYMGKLLTRPVESPLTVRQVAEGMVKRYGKQAYSHCCDAMCRYSSRTENYLYWWRVQNVIGTLNS